MPNKPTSTRGEIVRLRKRALANGGFSLYLDTYYDGKRTCESLKLYLVPEKGPREKKLNKEVMKTANEIKIKRLVEIFKKMYPPNEEVYFNDWLKNYKAKLNDSEKIVKRRISTIMSIISGFKGVRIRFAEVDENFCQNFLDCLRYDHQPNGKSIKIATARQYYELLNSILNQAVQEKYLSSNPFLKIPAYEKFEDPKDYFEYLTISEVKTLMSTPLQENPHVKSAFLFSCFCGLRLDDIYALTWWNVNITNSGIYKLFAMTGEEVSLRMYLPQAAVSWLPKRGDKHHNEKVFDLPPRSYLHKLLKRWAWDACIAKRISFDTARHTYATLLLTLGVDIVVVSELMGHSNVEETRMYERALKKRKCDPLKAFDGIFD